MTRPVELTTPSNGLALGAYWLGVILGASFLSPYNRSPAIEQLLHAPGFVGWAMSMSLCGTVAVVSVGATIRWPETVETALARFRLTRQARLSGALKGELVACAGLVFTFALYAIALLVSDLHALGTADAGPIPPGQTPLLHALLNVLTTKLLATIVFVIGGTVRCVQLGRELWRWRRARLNPRPADPVPLAAPDH